MDRPNQILIIAGPNGAGKTTFTTRFLPREAACPNFVNADLIALGLSPFSPDLAAIRAGRLTLETIRRYVAEGEDFAIETTLSGLTYARSIPEWKENGYNVRLFYLWLPAPELAIERVRIRVAQGGHGIPEQVIRRRYFRSWRNFTNTYRDLVDEWRIYDNSAASPKLIAEQVVR